MPQLESFLATWEKEFQTTLRVFAHYPADRLAYRPHEKSMTALDLMWSIPVVEREFIGGCLRGKIKLSRGRPPRTKEGLIRAYEKIHATMVKRVRNAGEEVFSKTFKFYVAPGKLDDVKVGQFLWRLLHDHIHHRGQLSVYLRLVGAKVPSIYGPSADEPW
jgi:uncharacterized damage-inducible protein DinB